MRLAHPRARCAILTVACLIASAAWAQGVEAFSIVSYNLENYLDQSGEQRPAKSPAAKAQILELVSALQPDVLAVQEMGPLPVLQQFRSDLEARGLRYPHWDHVTGWDTNIHLAILSRFPISERRAHTNLSYLLRGRRYHILRGFQEVEIQVSRQYRFSLLNAHLKSQRESSAAHHGDIREEEALQLRSLVENRLSVNPNANLIVLGDFNDVRNSVPVRTIIGLRAPQLIDTRPTEGTPQSKSLSKSTHGIRTVAWTHFFALEDRYSRIDYQLLSPGMAREWIRQDSFVFQHPNWGLASDHRPLFNRFFSRNQ